VLVSSSVQIEHNSVSNIQGGTVGEFYHLNQSQHGNLTGGSPTFSSLNVTGTITAKQLNISVVSSSVLYESGSTKFGNTLDDTHEFTGSVLITGSLSVNGNTVATIDQLGGNSSYEIIEINSTDVSNGFFVLQNLPKTPQSVLVHPIGGPLQINSSSFGLATSGLVPDYFVSASNVHFKNVIASGLSGDIDLGDFLSVNYTV
jgi:hypothetical protein